MGERKVPTISGFCAMYVRIDVRLNVFSFFTSSKPVWMGKKTRLKISFFPKGQLISKCLSGVFTFFQKTNENKSTSSKNEFVRSFFGRNVGLKKSFRICLTFTYTFEKSSSTNWIFSLFRKWFHQTELRGPYLISFWKHWLRLFAFCAAHPKIALLLFDHWKHFLKLFWTDCVYSV